MIRPAPIKPLTLPKARRAVLVVVDSLRADLITVERTPHLARLLAVGCRFAAHRSVFPSTTRTASASLATGCLPRHHGLLGNAVALDEGSGLTRLSTAPADFRERLRAATGRVLARPALPELLAGHGGAVIFSNASPGAAHLQDPDGHGWLFNRAGSHGPGFKPLPEAEHLNTPKGSAGDAQVAERFVEEVLAQRRPALAVLWLSEPDNTGHHYPLGGPEHLRALAAADACVGRVWEAVQSMDPDGERILLAVTSDHGQETTRTVIDVDAALIDAGLKAGPDSTDLVAASQGSAVLFFLAPEFAERRTALAAFLAAQTWAREVFTDGALEPVGLSHTGLPQSMGLAAAVSMSRSDEVNQHGIPGLSDIALDPSPGGINTVGCGQHGGTGRYEQNPFLVLSGGGFPAATVRGEATSPIDIAPTILHHLERPWGAAAGQDGRALQEPALQETGAGANGKG